MSKTVLDELTLFTNSVNKKFIPHPIYNIFGDAISKTDARKALHLNDSDKVILFFGFIRKYKGLELLLKSLTTQRVKDLNLKLIIAGEFYELENETKLFISENGLSNTVLLHNHFIDSAKVKEYFCASDMVVQPYITATQSGITQIAYHFGTPMLVTNVGGLAEIVEHNKVGYVVGANENEIADCIVDFYKNDREVIFRNNVQKAASKFSWQNLVDTIMNF